jgi:hypothetical protein
VAEGNYNDNSRIDELQERLKQLQIENNEIKQALREVANANVLPGIVQNGFANVIAQLQPLRDLTQEIASAKVLPGIVDGFGDLIDQLRPLGDLTPKRESVEKETAAAVAAMLEAMEGVTLKGDSLGIPVVTVPFIGEPRPQQPLGGGYRP